jgi:hypothetical protein
VISLQSALAAALLVSRTMDVAYDSFADGLDAWFSAWIHIFLPIAAVPLVLVLIVMVAITATGTHTRRRRFWCALRRRDVEAQFSTRGLLPGPRAVLACSAFEPSHAVACGRRCLQASYRRQWPPPLAGRDEVCERGAMGA